MSDVAGIGVSQKPIDALRRDAADSAGSLKAAFDGGDMTTFHFELGKLWVIAGEIYNRNHAADLLAGTTGAVGGDGEAYDISDPKHPEHHSTHADLYDLRDKTEG
jgi:hypothetical protein